MIVNVSELREKPQINWTPNLHVWMSKLSNEELTDWENYEISEATRRIEAEGRNSTKEEIRAIVREKAILLERGYHLFPSTQPK
jgi:hypothetical protein